MSEPDAVADAARATSDGALHASTFAVLAVLVATGLDPVDRGTWWLEVIPVVGVLAALWATRRRFPLTPVLHGSIALALAMICIGAHYTFERVPVGEWLQRVLDLERNPYDRLGHVVQGLVPALSLRELLVRASPLPASSRWIAPLVLVGSLAISAAYELVEWGVGMAQGPAARQFLGMQGDAWDAHWDMLCALLGATGALVLLGRVHDRALAALGGPPPR
jgi:putative membrane protein